MKAIIHIGMMKTGSTAIQTWLRSNRVALKAEGVYSPWGTDTPETNINHWNIMCAVFLMSLHEFGVDEKTAWMGSIRNIPERGSAYGDCKFVTNQLEKLSGKSGIFIYSRETLYDCNETQIAALDKFFSRFFEERTYVIYLRNMANYFVSLYSHKLYKNTERFGTLSFIEFWKKYACAPVPYSSEFSFENLLDWHKVLGDRLNVRLLESDWLVNADLIEDFASLASVAAFKKPGIVNESFAAEYIEYVRFLNMELIQDGIPRKIRKNVLEILKNALAGEPKLIVSDAQAKSFRDVHGELQEKIRKLFFPDRPFLFPPRFYGSGVAPTPLTECRKMVIESELPNETTEKVKKLVPNLEIGARN